LFHDTGVRTQVLKSSTGNNFYFHYFDDSLGTIRSLRPLSPPKEDTILGLLKKMQTFYKYHGI